MNTPRELESEETITERVHGGKKGHAINIGLGITALGGLALLVKLGTAHVDKTANAECQAAADLVQKQPEIGCIPAVREAIAACGQALEKLPAEPIDGKESLSGLLKKAEQMNLKTKLESSRAELEKVCAPKDQQ